MIPEYVLLDVKICPVHKVLSRIETKNCLYVLTTELLDSQHYDDPDRMFEMHFVRNIVIMLCGFLFIWALITDDTCLES